MVAINPPTVGIEKSIFESFIKEAKLEENSAIFKHLTDNPLYCIMVESKKN